MEKSACPFKERCLRNGSDYPMFLFPLVNRRIDIKAVIISQEPAAQRRKLVRPGDELAVERHLRSEGLNHVPPHPLLKEIQRIIGRPYDAFDDVIYWTHALKCIPKNDPDIRREWEYCAPECIKNLRSELMAIPAKELVVVTIGGYSTGLMLSLINGERQWLRKPPKINALIESLGSEAVTRKGIDVPKFQKPYYWEGREIYLTPFIHPSNKNRAITEASKVVEAEEIGFVRAWLAGNEPIMH